jgi:dipeptidyl aminopeptidase/acylaminoacyl peptidase
MVVLHQRLPSRRRRLNVHREFRCIGAFSKPAPMTLAMMLSGMLRSWMPGLWSALWLIGSHANPCYGMDSPRHAPTLADLTTLGSLDLTLSLSSDGNWLAMSGSDGGLTVVSTRNLSNLRRLGNGSSPLWSPDRTKLAFLSTRGGDLQLWVYERSSQALTQVTYVDGGIDPDPTSRVVGWGHDAFRYDWSPHSDALVFASRVPTSMEVPGTSPAPTGSSGSEAPLILTASTPAEWTLAGIFSHGFGTVDSKDGSSITFRENAAPAAVRSSALYLVSFADRRLRRLTLDENSYFNPAWSPDGQSILCATTGLAGPVWAVDSVNIVKVSIETGQTTALTHGLGVRSRPTWSPDGLRFAYLRRSGFFGPGNVFVVKTGKTGVGSEVNLTAGLDRQVDDFAWESAGSIVLIYTDGVSRPLAQLVLGTGTIHVLSPCATCSSPVGVQMLASSGTGSFVYRETTASSDQIRLTRKGRHSQNLVEVAPQELQWERGEVRVIHWRNHGGEELEGSLLLPVGYSRGTRYPLIVDAYPKIGGVNWTSPMAGNQVWAAHGYMVFRPSAPAPHVWMNPWKSPNSSASSRGPGVWNDTVDDILTGVDKLIDQGLVDPARMCLYGFSNGGGVVDYLVTKTTRFKCAVSVAGAMADWVRRVLLNPNASQIAQAWAGVSLRDNPQAYIQLSAVFFLGNAKTPMLLADGDNDGDILLDTIEVYNGLKQAGVDVTLLRYPGQGHGFTGTALEDFWERELAFFDRYLGQ